MKQYDELRETIIGLLDDKCTMCKLLNPQIDETCACCSDIQPVYDLLERHDLEDL